MKLRVAPWVRPRPAIGLLIACALLLVGAGILEGYVSPNPRFALWARSAIGASYWLFMVALLCGWLFGRRARRPVR